MPKIDYVDNSVTLRKYWDYCQDVHYKKLVSIKTNSDKLIDNDPPDTFNRSKYVLSTRHFQESRNLYISQKEGDSRRESKNRHEALGSHSLEAV
jgi:hypothetical protein